MSCTPVEFLRSAKEIREKLAHEAGYRAAISRAYYAMYHAAVSFHDALPSGGSLIKATGLHEKLAERLMNPTISNGPQNLRSRQLGIYLRDTHRQRVLADYKPNEIADETIADQTILVSEKFLNLSVVPSK